MIVRKKINKIKKERNQNKRWATSAHKERGPEKKKKNLKRGRGERKPMVGKEREEQGKRVKKRGECAFIVRQLGNSSKTKCKGLEQLCDQRRNIGSWRHLPNIKGKTEGYRGTARKQGNSRGNCRRKAAKR